MKLILSILLVFTLASCVTRNSCERKFPSKETTKIHDSTVITFRDSVIPVPGASATITADNPCDSAGRLKVFYIEKKVPGKPTQRMYSDGKTITNECECPDTTLIIKRTLETAYHKKETTIQPAPVIVYKTSWKDYTIMIMEGFIILYLLFTRLRKRVMSRLERMVSNQ